jgi:hypothetical protein
MTSCETKFKPESKVSGISLLNFGEGFVAVKNEDGPTLANASGVITGPSTLNNNIDDDDIIDDISEKSELTMLRLFYLGGISFVGFYLFYRIMSKNR